MGVTHSHIIQKDLPQQSINCNHSFSCPNLSSFDLREARSFRLASLTHTHTHIIHEHYFAFWHHKISQIHFVFSCSHSRMSSSLWQQHAFSEGYLETQLGFLGALITVELALLLGPVSIDRIHDYIFVNTHAYLCRYFHGYTFIYLST